MTAPSRPSPAPAWLPFARKLLHRLREPTGEALPDAELAADLGLASAPAARAAEGGIPWDKFPMERVTDIAALPWHEQPERVFD